MSAADEVFLRLERPLPDSLAVGRGTAISLYGACFHRYREIEEMEITVDGEPHRVDAFAMPRLDNFRALHPGLGSGERAIPSFDPESSADPEVRAYRSGFWATVPIAAPTPGRGEVRIGARLQLSGGDSVELEIATIEVGATPLEAAGPGDLAGGQIAICMATCDPDPELFAVQIASLRAQTDRDWICTISDDCSRVESFAAIEAELGEDPRFRLSRSDRRLGVYRNFERALLMVPPEAGLVSLCDQDDRWYPDKLERLRAGLGSAQLVYSDLRLTDSDGEVIADTYWTDRANNHSNLVSLLVANTVTGAASLMRREVVELALPFPEVPGDQFHDHWLALVALATGELAYIDRPLYDYVQHGGATLGHLAANEGIRQPPPLQRRDPFRTNRLRRRYGPSRPGYFRAYRRLAVVASALLARCEGRIRARKRRALGRFVNAEHSLLGAIWLLVRPLRSRLGRSETLGIERMLFRGILWRHLLAFRARGLPHPAGSTDDATDPEPRATVAASVHGHTETTHIERMLEPLELVASEREPERINVLIPAVDLKHLFGGYIAKFNLARKLAHAGYRVRIITVNRTPPLQPDWRAQLEAYSGLDGLLAEVEVEFGREGGPIAVSPADRFVATTWWTAHLAAEALREVEADRFLYLIQEFEPYTVPMGSLAALATQSYELPHVALFSTELLRRYFAEHRYGVYAGSSGTDDSHSFENAITAVEPPSEAEMAARPAPRLLFYARSEPHARRNMFELGLIAIMRVLERGILDPSWEIAGVGSVEGRSTIELPRGARLEMLPRRSQAAYGKMLPSYDIGLALMFTPHPSLVPIEMASAGLITVTNSFETKTPELMEAISPNLIAVRPQIEAIAHGLGRAVERVADFPARAGGARVDWSRDWDATFDPATMERIDALLERC